jgi:H+/Cl- antiporter ClcA
MWPDSAALGLVAAAARTSAFHPVLVLLGAGLATGAGQLLLVRLSSGNGIDITEAIWFRAGRLPPLRSLGSAVLSVIIVGMGVSLGREGAPKQVCAVIANALCDRVGLSDEQRKLLVACGAGAGMAAAYGVPLGGALFALEVLRGVLALRLVLPALIASLIATAVSWIALPDAPTYSIPDFATGPAVLVWAVLAGPIAGVVSVGYVRIIAWADRNKPAGWWRVVMPTLAMGALLGGVLGHAWSWLWPGVPSGLFAVIGAGAVLAATTQGPISAVVLVIELSGRDRSLIMPLLLAVTLATLIARTIEPRSIYDARLTDEEVEERLRLRAPSLR